MGVTVIEATAVMLAEIRGVLKSADPRETVALWAITPDAANAMDATEVSE
jgi:hypothetical protein